MSSKLHQLVLLRNIHSVVAPPGELRVKAGVVCWQVKLCDPHLSALEVRLSQRGAIQIDHLYLFYRLSADISHYNLPRWAILAEFSLAPGG